MVMTVPLMSGALPETRNATSAATSWGSPKRCIGLADTNCLPTSCQLSASICLREFSTIGVMIAPGAMALIEIPNWPYSTAELRVSPTTPCLEAE